MNYLPINEGIDHINIYSKSKLELGRQLSNFHFARFKHTQDGEFFSVEGYWYWLKTGCKHEAFRVLSGITAKTEGKRLPRVECPDFNERILEAIRCKLRQNKDILNNLTNSTLPLTHYYYFGDINDPKIVRLDQYQWIVDEIVRIRTIMRKHRGLQ